MQDEKIELKNYLMLRSLVISIAIVAGSLSAMLFDYLEFSLKNILTYCGVLGLVAIIIQYELYKKFKLKIYGDPVEISKEKTNIFEKFR